MIRLGKQSRSQRINQPVVNAISVSDRLPTQKVSHENQDILDFSLPTFALLFIFSHPQLSYCLPVLSIFFVLSGPLSVKGRYQNDTGTLTGAL